MLLLLGVYTWRKGNYYFIDPFQKWRHITWFHEVEDKHKNKSYVSEDQVEGNLEVFAQWWTFVRCLASQIVATERRTKDMVVLPQSCRDRSPKSMLWALNVERLGSPVLEGKILQLMLLHLTEFAVTILYQVCYLVYGTVYKVYCSIFAVVSKLTYLSVP